MEFKISLGRCRNRFLYGWVLRRFKEVLEIFNIKDIGFVLSYRILELKGVLDIISFLFKKRKSEGNMEVLRGSSVVEFFKVLRNLRV